MISGDTMISMEPIDVTHTLQRLTNLHGEAWSAIVDDDGREIASCPTSDEMDMLKWWEREGKRLNA